MTKPPLLRESIQPRLDGIMKELETLRMLAARGAPEFDRKDETFSLAQHHLRLALEGVFHIASHILSRLNGGRAREYRELAVKLGEHGIVPRDFAETVLVKMAGYRNRLTHLYAAITPSELHTILTHRLPDIEQFLVYVKKVIEHPQQFDLTIE
ncbi:MAG: DUF86 domain-containing protein [Candidatus Yonathbacteria bacterium]|nr:DUF86 domain-containing protein [Candidatus Yonathbacteria bacterium]